MIGESRTEIKKPHSRQFTIPKVKLKPSGFGNLYTLESTAMKSHRNKIALKRHTQSVMA